MIWLFLLTILVSSQVIEAEEDSVSFKSISRFLGNYFRISRQAEDDNSTITFQNGTDIFSHTDDEVPEFPPGFKVLITTGNSALTEIIDLKNPNFTCNMRTCDSGCDSAFPIYRSSHAVGGLVEGVPMVCGGKNGYRDADRTKECYKFQDKAWKPALSMTNYR